MRHGLQLAGIALLWLVGLKIDWDCPVPHCIMGSRDQWEFQLFFRPQWQSLCNAVTAGNWLPLGLCKGAVKESPVWWEIGVPFNLYCSCRLNPMSILYPFGVVKLLWLWCCQRKQTGPVFYKLLSKLSANERRCYNYTQLLPLAEALLTHR